MKFITYATQCKIYIVFHVDREKERARTAAPTNREKVNELNKYNWDCALATQHRTLVEQVKCVRKGRKKRANAV